MALFQIYVYRKRNQSLFYDMAMLMKFLVFLSSNVANALFVIATLLTLYLYVEFKHQKTLKVVAPFPEEHLIEFFFVAAFVMKVSDIEILLQTYLSSCFYHPNAGNQSSATFLATSSL